MAKSTKIIPKKHKSLCISIIKGTKSGTESGTESGTKSGTE